MPGSFAVERRLRGFFLSTFAAEALRIVIKTTLSPAGAFGRLSSVTIFGRDKGLKARLDSETDTPLFAASMKQTEKWQTLYGVLPSEIMTPTLTDRA